MRACFGLALVLLAFPQLSAAREAPEQLLPAGTQVYFRWDGIEAHRSAYAQTALGKMLAGDTGRFLASALNQIQDLAATGLTGQQLLQGIPPEQLQQIQKAVADAPKFLALLGRRGLIVGVEVRGLQPPAAQLTLIVPEAGDEASSFFGNLRLAANLLKLNVEELAITGRSVSHIAAGPVHVSWWIEGGHALLVVGTDDPQSTVKHLQTSGPRLVDSPLFKRVQGFKRFETGARAFADLAALVHVAEGRGDHARKFIKGLGLDGLKTWTFQSGFDGDAERTLYELEAPGPRTGLLRMLQSDRFKLTDVPPLPTDAVSWSVTNFDATVFYDAVLQAAESVIAIVAPDSLPAIRGFVEQIDLVLGISLRNDLLGSLGNRFALYNSPGEGIFTLGQTYLFRVRDAKKLQASLEQAIKAAAKVVNLDASIRKVTYHGVVLNEVHVRQQGFFFVPTFAIDNGWLAVSYYPQAIQGFVLRSQGKLPVWKPEGQIEKALAQLPQEFISISVTDPRATVRQFLTLAPLIAGGIKSAAPDATFEVGAIPNAHEATQHLFPNVSVVSDDGTVLRSETRASLALPIDLSGLDAYALFFAFGFAVRLF
jgi:hypothetical protein